jgi:hypothetical protein
MQKQLINFNLILTLIILCSCSLGEKPQVRNEDRKQVITELDNEQGHLLIVNGLSEDFSLLKNIKSDPKMFAHIPMASDDLNAPPCQSPNEIKEFEGHLYLVCSLSNEIHIFKKNNLELVRIIHTGNNTNPMGIEFLNSEIAYVSSYIKSSIIVLNPTPKKLNNRIIKSISLTDLNLETDPGEQSRPYPQDIILKDDKLFVALPNLNASGISAGPGYLAQIDTNNHEVENLFKMNGRNSVYLEVKNDNLYVLNAGTYKVGQGFLGDGSVDVFDTEKMELTSAINVGGAPFEMVINENDQVFITNAMDSTVLRFDLDTEEVLSEIKIDTTLCKLNPDFKYISGALAVRDQLYLLEFNSDCLLVYDTTNGEFSASYTSGDGPDVLFYY